MDRKLEAILEEFWQWRLLDAPEFGTMVGDHRRDDLLDDLSLAAYEKRLVRFGTFVCKVLCSVDWSFSNLAFACIYLQ